MTRTLTVLGLILLVAAFACLVFGATGCASVSDWIRGEPEYAPVPGSVPDVVPFADVWTNPVTGPSLAGSNSELFRWCYQGGLDHERDGHAAGTPRVKMRWPSHAVTRMGATVGNAHVTCSWSGGTVTLPCVGILDTDGGASRLKCNWWNPCAVGPVGVDLWIDGKRAMRVVLSGYELDHHEPLPAAVWLEAVRAR